jgi:hypothetical protein
MELSIINVEMRPATTYLAARRSRRCCMGHLLHARPERLRPSGQQQTRLKHDPVFLMFVNTSVATST